MIVPLLRIARFKIGQKINVNYSIDLIEAEEKHKLRNKKFKEEPKKYFLTKTQRANRRRCKYFL